MSNFIECLKTWWINHKPSKRRIIQLYAALLYNANIKGFITGSIFTGLSKSMCVPGLNCYSCPGAIGACPLGSLQGAMAKANKSFPFYVLGILMLYGLILGRTICGFLCPVGLVQELAYKIKSPKLGKNVVTRILSYFKYVLLIIFVLIIPLMDEVPAFCKYVCPAGIFEGAMFLLPFNEGFFALLGVVFSWKFALFITLFVLCIFVYRFFCRFICPLGAIYGLFNKFSIIGIHVDDSKCTNCGLCLKKCKMDVRKVGDHECIRCGDCLSVCPTSAIRWNGQRYVLADNEIEVKNTQEEIKQELPKKKVNKLKLSLQISAVVVLIGAITYANFVDKQIVSSENAVVGEECKDFKFTQLDGNEISISSLKGKITIINLWYVNCINCKKEMPDFEKFYQKYQDQVNVIAVNPVDDNIDDIEGCILDEGWEKYQMSFVLDNNEDNLVSYFFPTTPAYPFTIFLDENSVIKGLHDESMNEVMLESYLNQYKN